MTQASDGTQTEVSTTPYCHRCGAVDAPNSNAYCRCASLVGSLEEVEHLLRGRGGDARLSPRAQDLATPAVREYVEAVLADEPDDFERATALHVLGTIADERSFGIVVEQATEDDLPEGVARYLCRLGTPEAVARLAEWAGLGSEPAATALGHLGDERAAPALVARIAAGARVDVNTELLTRIDPAVWFDHLVAVFELATIDVDGRIAAEVERRMASADPDVLRQNLEARFGADRMDDPSIQAGLLAAQHNAGPGREQHRQRELDSFREATHRNIRAVAIALDGADRVRATPVLAAASARLGFNLDETIDRWRVPDPDAQPPIASADGDMVPAWVLDYPAGDPQHRGTRFGGQPTWLSPPTWPLTPFGTPMSFWGQVRLPDDPDRLALIFLDINDGLPDFDEALPSIGSVFVQPGGRPERPWVDAATGPVVPDGSMRGRGWTAGPLESFDARVPTLRLFHEPPAWDRSSPVTDEQERWAWDKVGGTPLFLQGDPDAAGWQFLCQFTADAAGYELGDAGQCYVFIDPANGAGRLTWDCH